MKKIIYTLIFLFLAGVLVTSFRPAVIKEVKNTFNEKREEVETLITEVLPEKITHPEPLRIFAPVSGKLAVPGVLMETNNERIKNGLGALWLSSELSEAANKKVNDMIERQYFEHQSPDGKDASVLAQESGYAYILVGENLAMGNFKDDHDLVLAWMASAGHRANILHNKYRDIGISVKKGLYEGKNVWLAVQIFGVPASLCSSPSAVLREKIRLNQEDLEFREDVLAERRVELESYKGNPDEFNSRVDDWNRLVSDYNDLVEETKEAVAAFNAEVRAYNACIQLP